MQVEVASYLFLVGLFGLKAPPAYILAACNHRIFQSDNRIVSRTIFENRSERGGFCVVKIDTNKVIARLCNNRPATFELFIL